MIAKQAALALVLASAGVCSVPTLVQAQQVKPVCTENTRACLLRTARIYLDGLSRHDPSHIPFAPDVRCTEQGGVPVADEVSFRKEIANSAIIAGSRNIRLMADPETQSVGAFYLLDISASGKEAAYTVRRGQRFKIVKGLVTEVEVFNYVDPQLGGFAKPLWPD